jgi:hypothetical protein
VLGAAFSRVIPWLLFLKPPPRRWSASLESSLGNGTICDRPLIHFILVAACLLLQHLSSNIKTLAHLLLQAPAPPASFVNAQNHPPPPPSLQPMHRRLVTSLLVTKLFLAPYL